MELAEQPTRPVSGFQVLHWMTLGCILLFGVFRAWQQRWLCDDAFVSFRYARNLVDGHGLVFNAGEYVEGYTNFAWTVLMALGMTLGIEPEQLSMALGLVSYALLILLLLYASRRMSADSGLVISGLPLAAFAWAHHEHARSFATSGLETMTFVLLVTACIVGSIERWKPEWVGVIGVMATLMRPDGALIYGLCALAFFVDENRRVAARQFIRAVSPGLLVFTCYGAWKLHYYGAILPNTFHAKSAHLQWWSQGLLYVGVYLRTYWPLGFGWLGLLVLWWKFTAEQSLGHWGSRRAVLLLGTASTLWFAYVARVGGDFMFSRFCLPVTPALLLALELTSHRLWEGRSRPVLTVVVTGGFLMAPWPDWKKTSGFGFGEEAFLYPREVLEEARHQGLVLRKAVEGLDVGVCIHGSQAMLAYYARFPLVIECHAGLTDRTIAMQQLEERGKPGHEKQAGLDYLLGRHVNFIFDFALTGVQDAGYRRVDFGEGVTGEILSYDRLIMRTLAQRSVEFLDFEDILDDLLAAGDTQVLGQEYNRVRAYYFRHNEDPVREAAFLEAVPGGVAD